MEKLSVNNADSFTVGEKITLDKKSITIGDIKNNTLYFYNFIEKLLTFLSGKKSTLASIIALFNGYLLAKGLYGELEFVLVGGLQVIIFGVASYQTGKIYKNISNEKLSPATTGQETVLS